MRFYPENEEIPERLMTKEFLIRPLSTTDVELDYKAVIANRENLLKRTNGRWPKEGFTTEENLQDLEYHEEQHHKRTEFTFTIMNVDETKCLGCIYIHPLKEELKKYVNESQLNDLNIKDYEAWMTFWVIPTVVTQKLDKRIVEELKKWFTEEWAFSRIVLIFGSRLATYEHNLIKDADLRLRYSYDTPKGVIKG
jgi:RimJ/RimL family protein N-acetyltransferase